ncbi:serine hydrolase [Rickettsiaceae bacterium]|nr:serine hydrolase [Rickettsiaceae bacterium]
MKKYSLLIIAIICNSMLSYADGEVRNKMRNASSEYIGSHFLNAAYMFCDDQGTIELGAKGYSSFEKKKQLEPLEQMPIASATKTMTAAAILKLRDKGLLDVNDTVAKYLGKDSGVWGEGEMPAWADKLTLHNLLTHRSGLPEYFMAAKLDVKKPHGQINKDIVRFAAEKELAFSPGEKHDYCNTNYVLLGMIVESLSGKSLGEFYTEEFFDPIGMKNTKLIALDEAVSYQTKPDDGTFPVRYFVTPTGGEPKVNEAKSKFIMIPFADGGVASTTEDLILWNRALHNGRVLSDDSYKLMTTKRYELQDSMAMKNYMGYGLYISELNNGDVMYHHAGNALAIRSESGCIPSKNLYFAVLSNVTNYTPKEFEGKIDMSKPENQLDIFYFLQYVLGQLN